MTDEGECVFTCSRFPSGFNATTQIEETERARKHLLLCITALLFLVLRQEQGLE